MVRVVSNRSGSYIMHMSLISPKNSVTFCTIWSCLPRSFFETRHFFWLANPFNSAKISLYSCSSVGRSPQESSRHRYVWTRLRCYSLVPRKFKLKSCDSAASNRLETNDVLVQMFGVEWFTLIQSPPQHTKVANLLPASFVVQDLVSPC